GVDSGALVPLPDLLRLFRLFRHGDRSRAALRLRAAGQLRCALPCPELARFLAALAHDALALSPRLSLHPLRRQPPWFVASARGALGDDDPGRPLAWRWLDLRAVGGDARRRPRRGRPLAALPAAGAKARGLGSADGFSARHLGPLSRPL